MYPCCSSSHHRFERKRYSDRGVTLKEITLFSDLCGEQFSGRKNFRMCSETTTLLKILLLWIFACPHHFAGVWESWGGTEAKLFKNAEMLGLETIRSVIDAVVKLRELHKDLIDNVNERAVPAVAYQAREGSADGGSDTDSEGSEAEGEAEMRCAQNRRTARKFSKSMPVTLN